MVGIGTIVNTLAVIVGGAIGLLLKKGLKESLQDSIMKATGICVLFIGLGGTLTEMLSLGEDGGLETSGTMLMIASMLIGTLIGELLHIEEGMERLGEFLKQKVKAKSESPFVEGFVTNALIICIGAMAVVGPLQDALLRDPTMLFTKAILDGVIAVVLASTLGVGVLFAALPLLVYQGAITLLASFIEPWLTDEIIGGLCYIGYILIFVVGLNITFGKRFRVANMLPALLVPVVWYLIV